MKDENKSKEALIEELRQLRLDKNRLQTIPKTAPIGIARVDKNGKPIETNLALQNMLGYSGEELAEMPFVEFTHPDDTEIDLKLYTELIEGKRDSYQIEKRYIRKDGGLVWGNLSVSLVRNDAGEVEFAVGMVEDITERKKAEQDLLTDKRFIERVLETNPNVIYVFDMVKQANIYANREITSILGYTVEEVQAMGENLLADILHPEDFQKVMDQHEKLAASSEGDILDLEYRMKDSDGNWHWLWSRESVFKRDKEGNPLEKIGTAIDVTDKKLAEKRLEEQKYEIMELSTPVIKVWEGIVVTPLIGTLDSSRTQQFMDRFLNSIVTHNAKVALIDITGVPTVDTQTAQYLIEACSAARLLGTQVVLTGIRANIAETLVHLGIDLSGVETRASLAGGMREALKFMKLVIKDKNEK